MTPGESVLVVDVTLRDGGYVNGHSWTTERAERVVRACAAGGVPYVEVGYFRPNRHGVDGAELPSASCPSGYLERLREAAGPGTGLVVMAHAKDVSPGALAGLARSGVRLVRMPTAPRTAKELTPYAEAAHDAGMAFSVNLIRVSELAEEEILRTAEAAQGISADVFYLADSNGSMFPDDVARIAGRVRDTVEGALGFHSHDGISMGFANSLMAMQHGFRYIDASLCGMGKGGGNLALELLTAYLNSRGHRAFSLVPLADAAAELPTPWQGDGTLARCESIVSGMLDLNLEHLASIRSEGPGRVLAMLDNQTHGAH
jgi:4-hydroxy 2-oxovalerate aldolase